MVGAGKSQRSESGVKKGSKWRQGKKKKRPHQTQHNEYFSSDDSNKHNCFPAQTCVSHLFLSPSSKFFSSFFLVKGANVTRVLFRREQVCSNGMGGRMNPIQ